MSLIFSGSLFRGNWSPFFSTVCILISWLFLTQITAKSSVPSHLGLSHASSSYSLPPNTFHIFALEFCSASFILHFIILCFWDSLILFCLHGICPLTPSFWRKIAFKSLKFRLPIFYILCLAHGVRNREHLYAWFNFQIQ